MWCSGFIEPSCKENVGCWNQFCRPTQYFPRHHAQVCVVGCDIRSRGDVLMRSCGIWRHVSGENISGGSGVLAACILKIQEEDGNVDNHESTRRRMLEICHIIAEWLGRYTGSGDRILVRTRLFASVQTGCGSGVPGHSRGLSGRGLALTAHPHLVPGLKKECGCTHSLGLNGVFIGWTLPFYKGP